MQRINSISVVGLGKLGLCIAGAFADKGFSVIGLDIDVEKLALIAKGISPINETGLDALVKKAKKNLRVTSDYEEAVLKSQVTFIVVATPSLADGSFSNDYLEKSLDRIALALRKKKEYHLVVVTSTVMPQTLDHVAKYILEKKSGKICGKDFGLAYNPEFIALGSVIADFLNPDFILIGEMSKKDGDILEGIYHKTCDNTPRFARMTPLNAEIAKISLNCYITTKITFANSLSTICEKVRGADAHIITKALGLDSRIGGKYLLPGLGFGGPCFPRDNVAFAAFARKLDTSAKLAEMVDVVNRDQVARVLARVKTIAGKFSNKKKAINVGILGLAYKPNTPIIDDSQALEIARALVNEGYAVSVYDPQAMDNSRGVLGDGVVYAKDMYACLETADIGIIAVAWPQFKGLDPNKIKRTKVILDCWRVIEPAEKITLEYLGVGS